MKSSLQKTQGLLTERLQHHSAELTGIENALAECAKSVRNMDWFEVIDTRGHIENGKVGHYQVTLKVGFRLSGS